MALLVIVSAENTTSRYDIDAVFVCEALSIMLQQCITIDD